MKRVIGYYVCTIVCAQCVETRAFRRFRNAIANYAQNVIIRFSETFKRFQNIGACIHN